MDYDMYGAEAFVDEEDRYFAEMGKYPTDQEYEQMDFERERDEENRVRDIEQDVYAANNASDALDEAREDMSPRNVTAVLCRLVSDVNKEIYNYVHATDCFCRPRQDGAYIHDPEVLEWIIEAVEQRMERELPPKQETLMHTLDNGQQVVVDLQRNGKAYVVAGTTISTYKGEK